MQFHRVHIDFNLSLVKLAVQFAESACRKGRSRSRDRAGGGGGGGGGVSFEEALRRRMQQRDSEMETSRTWTLGRLHRKLHSDILYLFFSLSNWAHLKTAQLSCRMPVVDPGHAKKNWR